jgi:hypothetical protein
MASYINPLVWEIGLTAIQAAITINVQLKTHRPILKCEYLASSPSDLAGASDIR